MELDKVMAHPRGAISMPGWAVQQGALLEPSVALLDL
jgi:hypothetical protein